MPVLVPRSCDSAAALAALAERQLAIVTRAQLRGVSLTAGQVNAQLEAHRWRERSSSVGGLPYSRVTPPLRWLHERRPRRAG
jgi:hypothetical protein